MREYDPRGTGTRDQRIEDAEVGYVAFDDADEPEAWHALLPALGIKVDATSGARFAERTPTEVLIGMAWGVYDGAAAATSVRTRLRPECISRIAGVALQLLPQAAPGGQRPSYRVNDYLRFVARRKPCMTAAQKLIRTIRAKGEHVRCTQAEST